MAAGDEVQVLISYKRLTELLEAADAVQDLRKSQERLEDRVGALHGSVYQLMDMVRALTQK